MVICCNSPVGCLCLVLIFRHLSTCWYIMPHLSFFPVHYKCPLILWYFLVAFGWTRWDVSCALDNDYFLNLLSFKNDHPYTKLHYKNISLSSSTFFFSQSTQDPLSELLSFLQIRLVIRFAKPSIITSSSCLFVFFCSSGWYVWIDINQASSFLLRPSATLFLFSGW